MAQRVAGEARSRTPADLIRVVRNLYTADPSSLTPGEPLHPEGFNWEALGRNAAAAARGGRAPGVGVMLGALDERLKERRQAQRHQKAAEGEAQRAKDLGSEEAGQEQNKQETDQLANLMYKVLKVGVLMGRCGLAMCGFHGHVQVSQSLAN